MRRLHGSRLSKATRCSVHSLENKQAAPSLGLLSRFGFFFFPTWRPIATSKAGVEWGGISLCRVVSPCHLAADFLRNLCGFVREVKNWVRIVSHSTMTFFVLFFSQTLTLANHVSLFKTMTQENWQNVWQSLTCPPCSLILQYPLSNCYGIVICNVISMWPEWDCIK